VSNQYQSIIERKGLREHLDVGLFLGLIGLGSLGVLMIYSATRRALINAGYNPHYYLERQGQFVLIGIILMYVMSRIDYRRLEIAATPLYVGGLLALAGVFVVGQSTLGAQRWYNLGFIQVQPSEFTVLFVILAIATYCQRRPHGLTMYDVSRLLVMSAVPVLLIFKQPDLGTCIIIVLTVGAMLVVAGVPPRFMTSLAVVGTASLVLGAFVGILHKYQVQRFLSFLNQNPKNASQSLQALIYQVNNAKVAIGAGGLHGAGLFNGLQTVLGYVPEQRTDFIFTAVGEQLGFFGSVSVVLLLAFVAYRIFVVAHNAKDKLGQLLCLGIFVFFSFSCFENIGMTMGIMPMTGIPLPLMSYGGSSAIVFYMAGGIVLSVSRRNAGPGSL
jgi:rod shape determining protein RodA